MIKEAISDKYDEKKSDEIMQNESLRVQKAAWVEQQTLKQREAEDQTREKLLQEQRILAERNRSITENMDRTRELQRYNEDCMEDLSSQVYALHGISKDKLHGMKEYKNAYYQGCALALFLLSLILTGVCGWLHGLGSQICLLMMAASGIEGSLLSQEGKRGRFFDFVCRLLYLLMFPAMLVIFISYEMQLPEYAVLQPAFVIAGIVILILGTGAYFLYNPYRRERGRIRDAKGDLREIEQMARKAVRKNQKLRKKEEARFAKQQKKEEERFARQQKREEERFARQQHKEEAKLQKLQKREEARELRRQKNAELENVRSKNKEKRIEMRRQRVLETKEHFQSLFHKKGKIIDVEPAELREVEIAEAVKPEAAEQDGVNSENVGADVKDKEPDREKMSDS